MSTPNGLDRQRIITAALSLLDRDGASGLSMRRLAAELGVEAMSLYHYLPSKDALLDAVVTQVTDAFAADLPSAELGWPEWLSEFAERMRTALLEHPGVLPLVATRPVMSVPYLEMFETGLQVLSRMPVGPVTAMHVYNTVTTFVIGHVLVEVADAAPRPADAGPAPDLRAYPLVAAAVAGGVGPDAHRERFELALRALIAGLPLAVPDRGGRP